MYMLLYKHDRRGHFKNIVAQFIGQVSLMNQATTKKELYFG